MDWLTRMNTVLDYIENNLDDKISENKIAELSASPKGMFQRIFAALTDMSLSEYVRKRRLTRAAYDIQNTNEKLINIAVKYGYSSADSFGLAFKSFHGVTPSDARKTDTQLQSFNPLNFKFLLEEISLKNVVAFNSYKLQKGASASDFVHAVEKMTNEFASKQKGWILSMKLVDGETWADFTLFESIEDKNAFAKAFYENEVAKNCFSFMDFSTMQSYLFNVEKSYQAQSFELSQGVNVAAFHSYKLKEGTFHSDFLLATEKLNNEFASKQSGRLSSMKLLDGETWADFIIFKSMDDMKAFAESARQNELVKTAQSFMDFNTMKSHVFSIERSF